MTTKRLTVLAVTVAALAAPAGASAGGWATVGLNSLPHGLGPGEPWTVELTILQHGRTPLEGVHPRVIVESEDGSERRVFNADATDEAGVYRAKVVFPTAGTWDYSVDDGFTQTHAYSPVTIGAGDRTRAAGVDDGGPNFVLALAAAAAAGLAVVLWRRRGPGRG